MTVMPGSLDYLYYNGVLNCIPYEAYSMPVATPSMNVNPYANYFQQEKMNISNDNIGADSFIPKKESSNKKISPLVKGLIAGGVLLTTLICILKGKSKKV